MQKKIRRADPPPYHHGDLRRALIDTALELVTEEQDWASRSGKSRAAPG